MTEYKTINFCVNVMAVFSLQSIIGILCTCNFFLKKKL